MLNFRRCFGAAALICAGIQIALTAAAQESTLTPKTAPPAEVRRALADVSASGVKGFVERLAGFGTRNTFSDTKSKTRGIGAARRWIKREFDRFAAESGRTGDEAIRVYLDSYQLQGGQGRIHRDVEIVNVVMEIPGSMPEARKRRYYVIGHYDSIPGDDAGAPGANDDASGTAVAMELARVLSKHRFDSTLVFMATAAEEQGLIGARKHAEKAKVEGWDIRAVLSNDIVGDPTSPSGEAFREQIRLFSEGVPAVATEQELAAYGRFGTYSDSPSRQIARFIADVAAWERTRLRPLLIFRSDRFGRGGDHSAFNRNGFPGVRFCELVENYEHQHQAVRVEDGVQYGDLPEYVDAEYLGNVTRLNGAALIHMANAPSSPTGLRVRGRTAQTTLRWTVSPEPDLAGYEVVWRQTTSPLWQFAKDVGKQTQAELAVSRDNHYFGIRAYDQDGYRSPVSFSDTAATRRR